MKKIGNGIKVMLLTMAAAFLLLLAPANKTDAQAAVLM